MVTLDVGASGETLAVCRACAWRALFGTRADAARSAARHLVTCHDLDDDDRRRIDARRRQAESRARRRPT